MAIAIKIVSTSWETAKSVHDQIAPLLPGVDIRYDPDFGSEEDVEMIVCDMLPKGFAKRFPNLKFIQKLGAGVETMARDVDLPAHVRISRLRAVAAAREIVEYCVHYVLREHRHGRQYAENQKIKSWDGYAALLTPDVTVGVLGLGHIGGRIAKTFSFMDFRTIGWSRSQKDLDGIDCRAGNDALPGVLAECDYVISILPSTQHTKGLMNKETLAHFKKGAVFINVGRGDLVVDDDLLEALDCGAVSHAILDVFNKEPLNDDHRFWDHPQVTMTPHISGWNVIDSLSDISENYKRLKSGEPFLNEISRTEGY